MADENRKWVYSKVEEACHDALMEIATENGVHVSRVIEDALDQFVRNYASEYGDKNKPKVFVRNMALEDRQIRTMFAQVKQLAYTFAESPTDDNMDRLRLACDAIGVDVETMLEDVSDKPHVSNVIARNGSLSKAELFLAETIKPGVMYYNQEIISEAEKLGIKAHAIKKAKQNLSIDSEKRGDKWYWFIKDAHTNGRVVDIPVRNDIF